MLFFSGDTDGAIPTVGSRKWVQKLGWKIEEEWRPWYDIENQVAGYIEHRAGNFTFATVKGVGHMAPQWARQPMQHLIYNWMNGTAV